MNKGLLDIYSDYLISQNHHATATGHKRSRMTTHYSQAELSNLIHAANKVCGVGQGIPLLTVLKRAM